MLFYAVVFDEGEDGEPAVVPESWVNFEEKTCFWPVSKSVRVETLIKKGVAPGKSDNWVTYAVTVIEGPFGI